MPSTILIPHLQRISRLYCNISPGHNLSNQNNRPEYETEILNEISSAHSGLKERITAIGRPRPITVSVGSPKGSWAHIYYVSFHDPIISDGPTIGFYPVFLMSVDQNLCWLTVALAAASVGISGRGGWSVHKGNELKERALFLGRNIRETDGWVKGPIRLGHQNTSLYSEHGNNRAAGRAYECGAIISKCFDPTNPPLDLDQWLTKSFEYLDKILLKEIGYIETSLPHVSQREFSDQVNAAITGRVAEEYFFSWAPDHHPEWGRIVSKTDRVGLGYDFEFPDTNLKVEVKGCRGPLESIRITEGEWKAAEENGDQYILAIVTYLEDPENTRVDLIYNPFGRLHASATRQTRLQVTFSISHNLLSHYFA